MTRSPSLLPERAPRKALKPAGHSILKRGTTGATQAGVLSLRAPLPLGLTTPGLQPQDWFRGQRTEVRVDLAEGERTVLRG